MPDPTFRREPDFFQKPEASDVAYTAIVDSSGYSLGIAEWNIPGYTPTNEFFPTYKAAIDEANRRNQELGLDYLHALVIVTSSQRAQNVLSALKRTGNLPPRSEDEDGA